MSELQDALKRIPEDWNGGDPIWRDSILVLRNAAKQVANLDMEAATSVLEGAYDVPPVTAKIMARYAVLAALGVTTEDDE